MLADGRADAHQPMAILNVFQHINGGEKLDAVGRWIAQRLEQLGRDQRRDVMHLAVQHPRRLLRREAGRQLAQQCQKLMLIVAHKSLLQSPGVACQTAFASGHRNSTRSLCRRSAGGRSAPAHRSTGQGIHSF